MEILHGASAHVLEERFSESDAFLTVTTYRVAIGLNGLQQQVRDCVILDEAQAIKNPAAKQTRQIKKLQSRMRIAMTGTPIENDLTNLWPLFNFLDKGPLGSKDEFRNYCRRLEERPEGYAKLKSIIQEAEVTDLFWGPVTQTGRTRPNRPDCTCKKSPFS